MYNYFNCHNSVHVKFTDMHPGMWFARNIKAITSSQFKIAGLGPLMAKKPDVTERNRNKVRKQLLLELTFMLDQKHWGHNLTGQLMRDPTGVFHENRKTALN